MLRQSFIALFLLFTRQPLVICLMVGFLTTPLIALEVTGTVSGLTIGQRVALAPNGNFGYVTRSGMVDAVSEFSTSTLSITRTVSVGNNPIGIAVTSGGDYAYVANNGTSSPGIVSRIDLSSFTVTDLISVTNTPLLVAIAPDGSYAYVTGSGADKVSRINLTTLQVDSLDVPGNPYGIAISPDSRYAYVACPVSNTITKIDITNGTFAISGSPLAVNATPRYIAIPPDGIFAYVTSNRGNEQVTKINLSTFTVSGTPLTIDPSTNYTDIIISPHGRYAYVPYLTNTDGNLAEINLATFSLSQTLIFGSGQPTGEAITSDGAYIYVVGVPTSGASQVTRLPAPPLSLTGVQKKNNAGIQYNLLNQLNWFSSTAADETGYAVYRNGVKIATLQRGVFSYTDSGVQRGVENQYEVRSLFGVVEGPPSNTIQVP